MYQTTWLYVSGDFNPDSVINWVNQKFGTYERKDNPEFTPGVEEPITEPIIKNVLGPETERVYLGYRFPGVKDRETQVMRIIDMEVIVKQVLLTLT